MSSRTGSDENSHTQVSRQEADDIMACAMEHYLKHHKVVHRKLQHAQSATRQSLEEIDKTSQQATKNEDQHELQQIRQNIEEYDTLWDSILNMFTSAVMTEEKLSKIENILSKIPKIIKKYYDILVSQDSELIKMMKDLASEKYQQALQVIKKLQDQPNLMSGLGPEEYDIPALEDDAQAFMFRTIRQDVPAN